MGYNVYNMYLNIDLVYHNNIFYKKQVRRKNNAALTSWCWSTGWSTSSGPLAGGISHSPLHGARCLGCTVGMRSTGRPFQRLIQKERLLVDIITLTTAAVGVARVIWLRVILWKEGRDTTGTFREKDNKRKKTKKPCLVACIVFHLSFLCQSHKIYPSRSTS